MSRFILLTLFLLGSIHFTLAQKGTIEGKILETQVDSPISDVEVRIEGLDLKTTTDIEGYFEFKDVPYGTYSITGTRPGYEDYQLTVVLNQPLVKTEPVKVKRKSMETEGISDIGIITLDLEDDNRDQNISGLLRSSEDIFVSTAGYTFGGIFFRTRGYDSENNPVMINGYEPENAENGRIVWSNWGGLNDAMRNKEVHYGLNDNPFSFGTIGSLTYINTRASQYRKQLKVSYSLTNRAYTNRLMLTWNSGELKNGWAFSLSGSRRWAQEGYIEGTSYDSWAYFLGVEKKFASNHSLGLTIFGSPTTRSQQGATVQEVYDLRGSNYYNPNWGYQSGDKRNARVKQFHNPVFMLNHFWDISDKSRLSTVAGYTFGYDNGSSLNWYNAADPRPDYYRYLPSYQTDPEAIQAATTAWQTDPNVYQINWNRLYQINYLSKAENMQSQYVVENFVTKYNQFYFNTRLNREVSDNLTVTGGLNFRLYKAGHYKEMLDLLGGDFWVDIDQYALQDFPSDSSFAQNDLNNPNRIIRKGDTFGYHYDSHINDLNLWAQGDYSYKKMDFYIGASLSGVQFWRVGHMKNGRHPDNSYGKSTVHTFINAGVKGGFTYKFTGRHFATINGIYQTRAPYFVNSYISPRVRDNVVPNLQNEKVYGGDINYIVRYPWFSARLTYYYTRFNDQSEVFSFYHDDFKTFVNYSLTGVQKRHQGIEFGADVKVTKTLSLIGVAALGDYRYINRPLGTRSYDNGTQPDTAAIIYLKNFYVPSTPQTALSGGLKFNHNFWFVNVNANYYDNAWLDFNPERRTSQALEGLLPGDPLIKTITEEQELKGGFTLDASVGKSFLIQRKVYINVNVSMTNILNNQDIQSGGYEQNRFDYAEKNINKYPPKYYYYPGRSFYINLSVRI